MTVTFVAAAALVLSHLAALPALIFLGVKDQFVDAVVLGTAVAISTLYHLCQVGWVCFGLDVHSLQIADHFMVFFALVWFLLYAAGATERIRTAVTVAVMGVSLPIIISKLDTWIASGVVVGLGVLAFVITFFAYAFKRGYYRVEWTMFVLALALIGSGVVLHIYAGDFGPDNNTYPVAHTVWHVLAFVSLYYIVWIPHVDTSPFNVDGSNRRRHLATSPVALARDHRHDGLGPRAVHSRPTGVYLDFK